jgi:hypothetical protein
MTTHDLPTAREEELDEELQQADDAAERAGYERGTKTPAQVIDGLFAVLESERAAHAEDRRILDAALIATRAEVDEQKDLRQALESELRAARKVINAARRCRKTDGIPMYVWMEIEAYDKAVATPPAQPALREATNWDTKACSAEGHHRHDPARGHHWWEEDRYCPECNGSGRVPTVDAGEGGGRELP